MDKKQIMGIVGPLARTAFSDEALELSEDMNASNVSGWTSLTFMQLLGLVESAFGFKFKVTELLTVKDMGGLISAIERHVL